MRVKAKNHDSIDITGLSTGKTSLIYNILRDELERTTNEVRKGLLPEIILELEAGLNQAQAIQNGTSPDNIERRRKKADTQEEQSVTADVQVPEEQDEASDSEADRSVHAGKPSRAERKAARIARREAKRQAREEKRRLREERKLKGDSPNN